MAEAELRASNPFFSRLVDVLGSSYLEDGMLASTAAKLKQAKGRFQAARRSYLEVLAASTHLRQLQGQEWRAAELQHSLSLGPDVSVLGLDETHLRRVSPAANQSIRRKVSSELEQRLEEKCLQLLTWFNGQKDTGSESFQLAKVRQFPEVLSQKVEELERVKDQLSHLKKEQREMRDRKHKICVELCSELCSAIEQLKLGLLAESEDTSTNFLNAQTQAMLGKLRLVHYQLLKGTVSDGQLQALREIRALLEQSRTEIEGQLVRTRQTLEHYKALGQELASLAGKYREIMAEIENKQWALSELGKNRM